MKGGTFTGLVFVVAILGMAIPAGADTHAPWPNDWNNWSNPNLMVAIGDPGNAADMRYNVDPNRYGLVEGFGSVAYEYKIGKYEVTAGQYTEFLNKVAATDTYGLYNTKMDTEVDSWGCNIKRAGSSGSYAYSVDPNWANRPVNYVSFWDACRFTNWLHNGQPTGAQGSGTTERGAYTLDGYNGNDGRTIHRNADANWAVTSEDEWYKAAYYKGGGTNTGYWDYPTSSDTAPGQDMDDASGNNANYYTDPYDWPIDNGKYTTLAGEFQNSPSPYGTFDQGGNVWEWNEVVPIQGSTYASRGLRGGAFDNVGDGPEGYQFGGVYLHASYRSYGDGAFGRFPTDEYYGFGFRVSEVPEPATLSLLALAGLTILRRRSGVIGAQAGDPRRGREHSRSLVTAMKATWLSS